MKARERKAYELWEASNNGDPSARDELWLLSEDMVKKAVSHMVGKGVIFMDSEDAYQAAMLAVGEALDKYDPEQGSYAGYMWVVIRNALMKANARDQNYGMGGKADYLGLDLDDVDDHDFESDEDPFRTVLAQEVWDKGLSALSERERDVITLRYKEENTYREIGLKLGTTHVRAFQIEQEALDKIRYALSV